MIKRTGRLLAAGVAIFACAPATAGAADGELTARGSVEQVHVTGATPGKSATLLRHGKVLDSRRAGDLGGIVFRGLEPGRGYTVRQKGSPRTGPVRVLTDRSKPRATGSTSSSCRRAATAT